MTCFYITFGQVHAHRIDGKTYDCDAVMLVKADNEITARLYVNALTGGKWAGIYTENDVQMHYYPRGVLNADRPIIARTFVVEYE